MRVELAAPLIFAAIHETAAGVVRHGEREARIELMLDMLRGWLQTGPAAAAPAPRHDA